jgi:hypothetical protein
MRLLALAIALLFAFGESAKAFCGFYVVRADTTMLNHASKVVLACATAAIISPRI